MARRFRATLGLALTIALLLTMLTSANVSAAPDEWLPVGNTGSTPALSLGDVYAFAVHGDDLAVAGDFANAGGVGFADSLALWDTSTWSAVGQHNTQANGAFYNLPATIKAVAFDGDDIYVGGNFLNAAGVAAADRIAMWDDSQNRWEALGPGLNGTVHAIVVSGNNVYVAGEFFDADGIPTADYVARWDGSSWSNLGRYRAMANLPWNGAIADHVYALAMKDGELYAGGRFTHADGNLEADYVARWTGSDWTNLGGDGADGAIDAEVFALHANGPDLLVGGNFEDAAQDNDIDHIAKWAGGTWSGFETDGVLTNAVYAIATDGNHTYVGGLFTDATGPAGDRVLQHDGTSWSPLGDNGAGNGAIPNNSVYALKVWDDWLYVGGSYTDGLGDSENDKIMRWGLPDFQPDGRVRNVPGSLVGNNKYNLTGKNQKKTQSGPRGTDLTYEVNIQNDSALENDSFYVHATGAATTHYRVTYEYAGNDITQDVVDGNYLTTPIAPGATYVITVVIRVKNSAPANSKVTRLVTITSAAYGNQDAVKVVGERT